MPCRFNFETLDGAEYVTIFKHGDDLRQDQLILQIITLMDMVRKDMVNQTLILSFSGVIILLLSILSIDFLQSFIYSFVTAAAQGKLGPEANSI